MPPRAPAPWKVVHVELGCEGPGLLREPAWKSYYVVFWWHGVPLGHAEILPENLPLSKVQLTNLALERITPAVGARLLERGFQRPIPGSRRRPPEPPDLGALLALSRPLLAFDEKLKSGPHRSHEAEAVSIIICTRERPRELERCLDSLKHLSTKPRELLVVDNAPQSSVTRQVVERFPNARYLVEEEPGLANARNTGVRHATGNILAFTDDDVTVHPDWIRHLVRAFDKPDVMSVTGLVLPAELETDAQVLFESAMSFHQGYQPRSFDHRFFEEQKTKGVHVWRIGAGANMALRREALVRVGGFDPHLGVGAAGCSEDSELWYRLLADGWTCRYEPSSVVFHYHRRSFDGLRRQARLYMRGHAAALLVQFFRFRHWGNLIRLLLILPVYWARAWRRGLVRRDRLRRMLVTEEVRGGVSGVVYFLRHVARWPVPPAVPGPVPPPAEK